MRTKLDIQSIVALKRALRVAIGQRLTYVPLFSPDGTVLGTIVKSEPGSVTIRTPEFELYTVDLLMSSHDHT